jgi:hypothetical protein
MTRNINITPVLNGFVCNIGCQTVVFNDVKLMAKEIVRYYKNPDAVEREYVKNAVNKTMLVNVPQPCPTPQDCVASEPLRPNPNYR